MKALLMLALVLVSFSARARAGASDEAARLNHLVFLNGAVHLHCTWTNGPNPSPTESQLEVEWKKGSDHSSIEAPGSFKVELYMPGMGHGSSPTQIDRVLDDRGQPLLGAYQVTGMFFTMPGDWEVRVTLKTPDGKTEMEKFPAHVDGSMVISPVATR